MKMELQALDQQLKVAIQNHQMLVAKMKSDPQNGTLKKQLHELQSKIKDLSERQKQVVQQLRLDLEIKQQGSISTVGVIQNHTQAIMRSLPQTAPLSLTTKQVDSRSSKGITLSATILLPSKVHLTAALTTSGNVVEQNRTPLAPVGGSSAANSSPSPSSVILRTADSTSSGALPPPIRVPQYPPPHSRPVLLLNNQKPASTLPPLQPMPPLTAITPTPTVVSKVDTRTTPPPKTSITPEIRPIKEDPDSETSNSGTLKTKVSDPDSLKTAFMTALGLITYDMLSELQSRRSERKRRTTANPQFSYGSWDHPNKKCIRNNYLSGTLLPGFKRPRGRPRLGSTTPNSRPSTPEDCSGALHNGAIFSPSADSSHRNGICLMEGDVCLMCRENGGDLLTCEVCLTSVHRHCVEPRGDEEVKVADGLPWICQKCTSVEKGNHWPRSLAIVHSYIMHKTGKEEEKRKLLKRGGELKAERNHLEQRAKQLSSTLSMNAKKRSELLATTQEKLQSIEKLKLLIKTLQTS